MAEKKLFLLDAYALIYRAYYAFIRNPRVNSKGLNTSAIFGFVNTLDEILKKEHPTHIAVVFDPPGGTFRNEIFPDYKANREETPEDIRKSIPIIREIISAYNIPVIELQGYEADDVIGAMAYKAALEGFSVYMMTPDKDYGQLVQSNVSIYKPSRSGNGAEIINSDNFSEKTGLAKPEYVIDMLALMGDASDNIPGCPGVGEKTALKLIEEFGSVDDIYSRIGEVKGKLKDKLVEFKEQVYLSRHLATIVTELDVEIDEEKLLIKPLNVGAMSKLFDLLEFRNIKTRILGETVQPKPIQGSLFPEFDFEEHVPTPPQSILNSIDTVAHEYYLIENEMQLASLRAALSVQKAFCFDTETTSLDIVDAELVGISICFSKGEAYYISVPDNFDEACKMVSGMNTIFSDPGVLKIGQNMKYDISVLSKYGLKLKGKLFDTMLAHYILQPELRHNMDFMAETLLGYKTVKTEELLGQKGKDQISMREVEVEKVKRYACEDADITFQLYEVLVKLLDEKKMKLLFENVEMPLVEVLSEMEMNGVSIDTEALSDYAKTLIDVIIKTEDEILKLAGYSFNIGSPKQVGEVLFDHLKIDATAKKTKSGQYGTSEEVLQKLAGKHPIVDKILEHRGLKKLLSTYVEALPQLVNSKTNRIHSSYNQAVTSTGRLSSTNPNLQNIPIRDEAGRELRKAFVPQNDEYVLVAADYSQVELRLMAHLSADPNMLEAFRNGEDIHAATAAKIYGVAIAEVTSEMRRKAKTANFGIIYGISAFGLAERLNISRSEAKELIDGYFNTYPKVQKYMEHAISKAREEGFVETIYGRRRYLADINSRNAVVRGMAERNAINAPIQGSAADVIKIAMVKVHKQFKAAKLKSKMIMQVHDELVFEVYKPELEHVLEIVKYEMEHAADLKLPLCVDCGVGNNWLQAH